MITYCAYCKHELNRHDCVSGNNVPNDGDFGFCAECGESNKFMNGVMVKIDMKELPMSVQITLMKIKKAWEAASEDLI